MGKYKHRKSKQVVFNLKHNLVHIIPHRSDKDVYIYSKNGFIPRQNKQTIFTLFAELKFTPTAIRALQTFSEPMLMDVFNKAMQGYDISYQKRFRNTFQHFMYIRLK